MACYFLARGCVANYFIARVQQLEHQLAEEKIDRDVCQMLCASITAQFDSINHALSDPDYTKPQPES